MMAKIVKQSHKCTYFVYLPFSITFLIFLKIPIIKIHILSTIKGHSKQTYHVLNTHSKSS